MEDKNKKVTLFIIGVLALLVTVLGASYAYFTAQVGSSTGTNVEATTNTTDSLTFNAGDDISIYATLDNFGKDKGSLSSTTTASATLLANNKTNTATMNYNIYLNIIENNLEYTTTDKKAELLLTVISPAGEVKELNGLDYVTYEDGIAGFDITEKQELITIANNYEIKVDESSEDHSKTDNWQVKITLVNLDDNQNANLQKVFNANVIIQKEKATIAMVCKGQEMASCIAKNYELDNSIIYHNGTITDATYGIIDAEDNNYRYAGPSEEVNNFVCFGSDAQDCPNDNLYRIIGVFNETNIETREQEQRVKLIKYDYALDNLLGKDGNYKNNYAENGYPTSYYKGSTNVSTIPGYNFNSANGNSSTNDWTISRLNTVNLNINYINNIGENWADKIAKTTWKIGGVTLSYGRDSSNIAKVSYNYELGANSIHKTYPAKIGLIYISDYYYAASPTYWTYYGYNSSDDTKDYREAKESNWMYMGLSEWAITPRTDNSYNVFNIYDIGLGGSNNVYTYGLGVRPCFYLKPSTMLSGGSGTMSDPYRIS